MEEKKELLDQDERVVEIELERLRGFVNHRRTILCGVGNLCSIVFSFLVKKFVVICKNLSRSAMYIM